MTKKMCVVQFDNKQTSHVEFEDEDDVSNDYITNYIKAAYLENGHVVERVMILEK